MDVISSNWAAADFDQSVAAFCNLCAIT